MARTAGRPLPSGRLSERPGHAVRPAGLGRGTGLSGRAAAAPAVAVLAAVSWLLYVWVYTPLKPITLWQTPVGARGRGHAGPAGRGGRRGPGAPRPGCCSASSSSGSFPTPWPSPGSIGEQFAAAEVKVATVVDPSGRAAGRLALCGRRPRLSRLASRRSGFPHARPGTTGGYIACSAAAGPGGIWAVSARFSAASRGSGRRRLFGRRSAISAVAVGHAMLALAAPAVKGRRLPPVVDRRRVLQACPSASARGTGPGRPAP